MSMIKPDLGKAVKAENAQTDDASDFENFIYLISHDVRASVRALIELPQWISEDLEESGVRIDGSVRENIELMNRHTGRLDRMLVDLLTFSRVGRMQNVVEVDLDAALDEVLDELPIPSNFKLIRSLEQKTVVMGERDVLTMLLALVSNAIKHNDKGAGKVIITSHREKDQIVICVRDDGPGIPSEFREKVFGAMITLKPRDEVEGSGMGLANTRKIANLYNGSVKLLDNPDGTGTCVEVRLPLRPY